MGIPPSLKAALERLRRRALHSGRSSTVLAIGLGAAVISLGLAEAAVRAESVRHPGQAGLFANLVDFANASAPAHTETRTVWIGADLDGDGQPDVANPTGHAPRGTDAYGEGCFHASRDGGAREHEGVDYVATAGQTVKAPISGFVSKIGYAYPDDQTLRFVEIDNPALHLTARVFYVDPSVELGQAVAIGTPVGATHTLQKRYPGITDHVHFELAENGQRVDAARLIVARAQTIEVAAD